MNTEKKVFNKLFSKEKINLKSQKIELGLLDDAAQLNKIFVGLNTNILKNGEKANELYSLVQKDGQMALAAFQDASRITQRIAKVYEDLGIPSDGSDEPAIKSLLKEMDNLLTYRKRYSF